MKKVAIIIALLLCLCACGNIANTETTANDSNPSDHIYPLCYDSLSDLYKSINQGDKLFDELSKQGMSSERIEEFRIFIEKYKSQGIVVPKLNGKDIELRNKDGYSNISLYPSESYKLAWIFFHPYVSTGENFYIKMAYLPDGIITDQKKPTASEVIKELSPNSPNINNLGEQHEKIYNQTVKLKDREVTALVIEYKTDSRSSMVFVYEDLLIEIRSNPEVWSEQWLSILSFDIASKR